MEQVGLIVATVAGLITIIGGVYAFARRVAKKRASRPTSREDELLVKMSMADHRATIEDYFGVPRHLAVGNEQFINEGNDLYRLQYLEAMDNLVELGYVDEVNEGIFQLRAKGLERAQEVRKRGSPMPQPGRVGR